VTNVNALSYRYWIECAFAGLSACLLILTVAVPEWIELIFGVDPDGGNGSLEIAILSACLIITIVASLAARREWSGRLRNAPEPTAAFPSPTSRKP
jgi:hypothetical protein